MSNVYDELARKLPVANRTRLEPAIHATLTALGATIGSAEVRRAVADAIDPALATPLRAGAGQTTTTVADLSRRIAGLADVHRGVGFELVQVLTGWLVTRLPERLREQLRDDVPPDWAALAVEPPTRPASLPIGRARAGMTGTTLADGAPGSTHPVSRAAPIAGHAASVARADDPHADRRLSSAQSDDRAPEGRRLADGEPGAGDRSLSRKDE